MNELASLANVVDMLEKKLYQVLAQGYKLAEKAEVVMGRKRMEELSFSVNLRSELSISARRVMGVSVPAITLNMREFPPYYSLYGVSVYVDEVVVKFKEILNMLAELSGKKIALLRLAKEAQKTIRKVNALEKIYIPQYRDTVKYITDRLDEEARDAFTMSKLVKERLKN